jgi:hypothetical protein
VAAKRLGEAWFVRFRRRSGSKRGDPACKMQLMLLFTVVFFAVAFLYVKACQKLR